MGNQFMWLGDTALPFLMWTREREEGIILVECAELFDDDFIAELLPGITTALRSQTLNPERACSGRTRAQRP